MESLASDFAIALGVEDCVVKRMPGDTSVSIFVPNRARSYINFLDTMTAFHSASQAQEIPINFGVNSVGKPFIEDLATLPHMLIAGATGSGKSTFLASAIASLVYSKSPTELQLVMSDTKQVEFGYFIGAPHLVYEPATTPFRTLEQLDWTIDTMEQRLKQIGAAGCRNIIEYNTTIETVLSVFPQRNPPKKKLPRIVVIIDELADILMFKGDKKRGESKIAEEKIQVIAQKGRAAGVHLLVATQRPDVKTVSGTIKANFPARLSFRLPSGIDSRTVLATEGAEHLLARGDMLYVSPNRPGIVRLHSPFAKISDIIAAVECAARKWSVAK
jgi:S-DNA-T family DNA segregation ATPase FtsK/SpoIIIE